MKDCVIPEKLIVIVGNEDIAIELVLPANEFEEFHRLLNGKKTTLFIDKAFPAPVDETPIDLTIINARHPLEY